MHPASRVAIAFFSFFIAVIFASPNLALITSVALIVYAGKFVSAIFCLIFTYHIAKIVESAYQRTRNENKSDIESNEETSDETERIYGQGFSYVVKADKISFTFEGVQDHDGRQLNRLKFMREKFYKDE